MEEIECSNQARLGLTFNYILVQIRDTASAVQADWV